MNTDFKKVMSERTDEELIVIVTVEKDNYQPLAIVAAEEEIKKRNIDPMTIEKVAGDLKGKKEKTKYFETRRVRSITRLIHFVVDSIAFILVTMILSFIVGIFFQPTDRFLMTILGYLLLTSGFFGYYVFMETKYQKTIGKFITKTTVITKDGEKPTMENIIRRTFYRLLPFDRLSFLFAINGFHDRLSDTLLIKDEN